MICPACKYQSGADDRCPECGRYFYLSRMMVESRTRFVKVLVACHVPWFLVCAGLLFMFVTPGDGLGRMFSGIYLFIGLALFAVEVPLVYVFLYRRLETHSVFRYLWCFIVVVPCVLVAGYLAWLSFLFKLFL